MAARHWSTNTGNMVYLHSSPDLAFLHNLIRIYYFYCCEWIKFYQTEANDRSHWIDAHCSMLMHDFEQPYQPSKPPNDVVHHAKKWGTKRSEYIYLLSIVAQKREYLVHPVVGISVVIHRWKYRPSFSVRIKLPEGCNWTDMKPEWKWHAVAIAPEK